MPRPTNTFVAGNDISASEQNANWTEAWDAIDEVERARQKTFTAGEDISAGDAVKINPAVATPFSDTTDDDPYGIELKTSVGRTQVASKIVAGSSYYFNKAILKLKRTGNCGVAHLAIREGSAVGTVVCSADVAQASIGTSTAEITFDFGKIVRFVSGSTYYFVLYADSATNTDFLYWCAQNAGGGAGDNFGYYNGSWNYSAVPAGVYRKLVMNNGTAGQIKKARAITQAEADLFIGFAEDAISNGNDGVITIVGLVTKTGLTEHLTYYLSDTAGAIALTAGTVSKKVGKSISTTELLAIPQL